MITKAQQNALWKAQEVLNAAKEQAPDEITRQVMANAQCALWTAESWLIGPDDVPIGYELPADEKFSQDKDPAGLL